MTKLQTFFLELLILIASVLFLTGCAGTAFKSAGVKNLQANEVAVLEHHTPAYSLFIISHVDGKNRGIGIFKEYILAPGEHSIRLTAATPVGPPTPGAILDKSLVAQHPIEVVFTAEAGKRYVIDVQFDIPNKTWGSFVMDKSTGKVVSTTRSVL